MKLTMKYIIRMVRSSRRSLSYSGQVQFLAKIARNHSPQADIGNFLDRIGVKVVRKKHE